MKVKHKETIEGVIEDRGRFQVFVTWNGYKKTSPGCSVLCFFARVVADCPTREAAEAARRLLVGAQ